MHLAETSFSTPSRSIRTAYLLSFYRPKAQISSLDYTVSSYDRKMFNVTSDKNRPIRLCDGHVLTVMILTHYSQSESRSFLMALYTWMVFVSSNSPNDAI